MAEFEERVDGHIIKLDRRDLDPFREFVASAGISRGRVNILPFRDDHLRRVTIQGGLTESEVDQLIIALQDQPDKGEKKRFEFQVERLGGYLYTRVRGQRGETDFY